MQEAYSAFRTALGGRIARLVAEYPTKIEASRIAGVSPEQLSRYEKDGGPMPALDVIARMAADKSYSMDWVALGRGAPKFDTAGELDNYALIPVWKVEASSGYGASIGIEEMGDTMPFPRALIRAMGAVTERNLHVVFNRGDSNMPDINHGDAMIVDRGAERIVEEAYYVFSQEGALFVKMIERLIDGGILVKSRNERYGPAQRLTKDEAAGITVFGRVRWRGGLL